MEINQIAVIHTKFSEKFGIPRQSNLVPELMGEIEFLPEYRTMDAVRGLGGYSYIWLLWGFSEAKRHNDSWAATVAPPRLGGKERVGVFASRSPFRPNPIGLSSVKLEKIEIDEKKAPRIYVSGIDMLDNTPIYDIKPYLPHVDSHENIKAGFAGDVAEHRLKVDISEDLLKKIDEKDRACIIKILEQDPRTAFIHDENRVWGISYSFYNIKFIVKEDNLFVINVEL